MRDGIEFATSMSGARPNFGFLKNFKFPFFRSKEKLPPTKRGLAEAGLGSDFEIMRNHACTFQGREEAIAAYRRQLNVVGPRSNIFMCFMSEVDTPSPDLELRRNYREKIMRGEI